ncbi:unnamed protein product [Clonostachys rhizophaga]|uniref:Uncharacterized protein n=1 Tax=Clonostachys rhizophaga TaxID=160324 RepID=A0A9N9YKV0_9HYPO|nr:unnamed protein product [Clonostachys rhizophaga]
MGQQEQHTSMKHSTATQANDEMVSSVWGQTPNHLSRRRKQLALTTITTLALCLVWRVSDNANGNHLASTLATLNCVFWNGILISKKIWLFMLPMSNSLGEPTHHGEDTTSWPEETSDYQSILVGERGANRILQRHYHTQLGITNAYNNMENGVMRSDLLGDLALSVEGGMHADTDTFALKAIDDRLPLEHRD